MIAVLEAEDVVVVISDVEGTARLPEEGLQGSDGAATPASRGAVTEQEALS